MDEVSRVLMWIGSTIGVVGSYDGWADPRAHLDALENCFRLSALPPMAWVNVGCGTLRGEAAAWANGCSDIIHDLTWTEFRQTFLREFGAN